MNSLSHNLDEVVEAIERAKALDRPAEKLAGALRRLVPDGIVKDTLSGTAARHPAHPALVAVPMGAWLAASLLDFLGGPDEHRAAQRLVGLGTLAAIPAAATGTSDWLDTEGAERRVGLIHASLNFVALGLYSGSWLSRRRRRQSRGVALALGGAGLLCASGWLGGHLAYAMGVGVDTTVFQQFPAEWTDVSAESTVPADSGKRVELKGVPVLLARAQGRVVALADRCTHRGAPLDEGTFGDDCVTCPWHGSRFRLSDGVVARGPATRPQSVLDVRTVEGRVQVRRRKEARSLRMNPVGH